MACFQRSLRKQSSSNSKRERPNHKQDACAACSSWSHQFYMALIFNICRYFKIHPLKLGAAVISYTILNCLYKRITYDRPESEEFAR